METGSMRFELMKDGVPPLTDSQSAPINPSGNFPSYSNIGIKYGSEKENQKESN